jgi:hypothetical protein
MQPAETRDTLENIFTAAEFATKKALEIFAEDNNAVGVRVDDAPGDHDDDAAYMDELHQLRLMRQARSVQAHIEV